MKCSESKAFSLATPIEERIRSVHGSGLHKTDTEAEFLGYLIFLGLARYEKMILPLELANPPESVPRNVLPFRTR